MTHPRDVFKDWYAYSDMAHKWRGEVISHAIGLEQAMEVFIAKHYVIGVDDQDYDQKTEEFKKIFFWDIKMGFGNKMIIVKEIIKLYKPLLPQMYPECDLNAELTRIIQTRNEMAHWQLDFSHHFRWNGAKYRQMKINKLKTGIVNIYSEEGINDVLNLCRKYTNVLFHWSSYPISNALPVIFYQTEERLSKLTELERTRLKNEYKK